MKTMCVHAYVRLCVCLLLIMGPSTALAVGTEWLSLSPGLEYSSRQMSRADLGGHLHVFRIDLTQYRLDLALAEDYKLKSASVRDLGERSRALLAINGGFFSPDPAPLGLRVQGGRQRHRLKNTSWWGVFSVVQGRPRIHPQWQYRASRRTSMAIQSGPRLVVNGSIPTLKPGTAQRSALGIDRQGRVLIVATENAPMTTTALAKLLQSPVADGGFNCRHALNLDGGRSTQIYARIGNFRLNVPNLSSITDAVIVTKR
jgi:uncharacterized protein YigE (DUF2233 family)